VDCQTVRPQMLLGPLQRLRRDPVVSEKGPGIVEWFCRAQAIAYVPQMTQGAGQVALEDVRVQQVWLAVAHGLDEVGEVVAATVEPGQHLSLGRKSHSVETVADEVAVAAMEDVADRGPFVVLGRQATYLEDQFAVAVVEDTKLRVGRLAVVDVAEATAEAENALAQLLLPQAPAGNIHLMNALVAQVAVAVVPLPMPVVVETLAEHGTVRGRAAPQVVVDRLRDRLRAVYLADTFAPVIAQGARDLHLAELAGTKVGDGVADSLVSATLCASLADTPILAGDLDEAPALADIVADRLLDVDVL